MACPFFFPQKRLEDTVWAVPPRLPLGGAWAGECRAGSVALEPDAEKLRQLCNTGYGRERCEYFPPEAAADAVRFQAWEEPPGLVRLQYIFERDCRPAEHGWLEYSESDGIFRARHRDPIIERQAEAFLESRARRYAV